MAGKSDTIFFAPEKYRIEFVIGHTMFFTCEENCTTNRIALLFKKKLDVFYSKRLQCVNLSTHIKVISLLCTVHGFCELPKIFK